MALVLAVLPVFAWWAVRRGDRLGVAVLVLGLAFLAQCTVQSDYPERKMLILLPLIVPIAVGGILRLGELRAWVRAEPRRRRWLVAWAGWVLVVAVVTLAVTLPARLVPWGPLADILGLPARARFTWTGSIGGLIVLGGAIGVPALLVLLAAWDRPRVARVAGGLLLAVMLVPLAGLDARYVFTHVTSRYRDTMIDEATRIDGTVTTVDGYAMQLYNTSRPVLEGYVFGMSEEAYEQAVVRFHAEGRGSYLYDYADPGAPTRWERLGFRLVERLPIQLPRDRVLGVFVYDPQGARTVRAIVSGP